MDEPLLEFFLGNFSAMRWGTGQMSRHANEFQWEAIDRLIQEGRGKEAQTKLSHISPARLLPRERPAFARLAWRSGLPELGIRALAPVVKVSRATRQLVAPEELAEYAHCLIRIGAEVEGEMILQGLDQKACPRVLLYLASAHISRWDYRDALPLLKRYVQAPGLGEYQRLVAKCNVVGAYVHLREHGKVTVALRELLYETSLKKHRLLYAGCLELAAQNFILLRQWKDVERYLSIATELTKGAGSIDSFFVEKWWALFEVAKSAASPASLRRLAMVRGTARRLGHWETLRQCDAFEAVLSKNEDLLVRVWCGTPHGAFRDALRAWHGRTIDLPTDYLWDVDGVTGKADVLDVVTPEKKWEERGLKSGFELHRMLVALTLDFYRPLRMAFLHRTINPDEFYNPETTPHRMHMLITRLRGWLKKNRLPISVEHVSDGAYRIAAKAPCRLAVPCDRKGGDKQGKRLERLRAGFSGGFFSVSEASRQCGVPYRTLFRLLEDARLIGKVARVGNGRATRYRFV